MAKNPTQKKTHDELFAESIIKRLEAGTTPWQRGWSINEALRKPFHNCISGKAYRGANIIRCLFACEENGFIDPRFITFKQASDKGWRIKAGSHGTAVSFFKPMVSTEENPDTGEQEEKRYFVLRGYTVFNGEQIDGIPALPPTESFTWTPVEIGEKILAESGAKITHNVGNRCYYSPSNDEIVLPYKDRFIDAGEYYGAAIHELAHWTGHKSRLDRKNANRFGTEDYAKEELRAEIASWMISAATGLPFNPDNHAAYVANWIKAIKDDYKEIFRACADAQKIQDYLLAFLPAGILPQTQAESEETEN